MKTRSDQFLCVRLSIKFDTNSQIYKSTWILIEYLY